MAQQCRGGFVWWRRDVICYDTSKLLNQVLDMWDRRELLMLETTKASFRSKEIYQFGKISLCDSEAKDLLKIIDSFIDLAGETLPQIYLL